MKFLKLTVSLFIALSFVLPDLNAFAGTIKCWHDVVKSRDTINIFVEDIANGSEDKIVDPQKVTLIVKDLFAKRTHPKFILVNSKDEADIVFSGVISEYIWLEEAPLTNVFSAGGIVMDEVTRRDKNWARIELDYRIIAVKTGRELVDYETQVTLKQKNIPKDKSYDMIYERLPKVLARDVFRRNKGKK